jgi:hypothetical protein
MQYLMQVILQYNMTAYKIVIMPILEFQKKRRDTPLTVRLAKETIGKLKEIAAKHDVSQADVIERLIETGYEELTGQRTSKKNRPKAK